MSSLTNVNIRNAPAGYWPLFGHAAWKHPPNFEAAEGVFPLLLQTIQVPWEVEHPKILAWATLLQTAYGAKRNPFMTSTLLVILFVWTSGMPIPLGLVTAYLAGANIDARNWKHVLPAMVKMYGVDPMKRFCN